MRIQIARFPLHQNAKVIAVLMALSSLIFALPMFVVFLFMPAMEGQQRPSAFMFLLFPFLYLVMGYVMVAIGCALYNLVSKYVGGIEYETDGRDG
ncbi:hypothetical protein [Noviherbaspirillum aerium]|uniref:hypothetical protein n=1 Tax=Noviherbaspirillum aerium TaxID=2588497 RepID=UPI00124C4C7D|nr:hypothetical protein [Noviherbaspirillum aerium]